MNEKQTELFMQDLQGMYSKAHNKHMDVIRRYMNGLLSEEAYRVLDKELTVKLATLTITINLFLHRKNN